MTINQISIFIENRKNALSELTNVLAEHNINLRAIQLADRKSVVEGKSV